MPTTRCNFPRSRGGFTLVEALVATTIGVAVIVATLNLMIGFSRSYRDSSLLSSTSLKASMALERLVYGVGTNAGLRAAQSNTVTVTYPSASDWRVAFNSNMVFSYTQASSKIVDQSNKVICTNVIASTLTNLSDRCQVSVTVAQTSNKRSYTNVMSTIVEYRN